MTVVADAIVSLRNIIIAVNAAALAFLIGALVAAVRARRRQPVEAPNKTPYLDDPALEGPRLERILAWALGTFAVIAISLPAYWLIEPTRQDVMDDQFLETSVEQGAELFASAGSTEVALGCADCHGPEGQGGTATQIVNVPRDDVDVAPGAIQSENRICTQAPDEEDELICQVAWRAPALDDVFERFSRDEVGEIIVFGRPGTPMPSWGLLGGGAKNDQSIGNILDYLESIQISPDEAKAKQADLTDGRVLFQENCARCHTKHWSYLDTFAQSDTFDILGVPGGGAFGPNLSSDVTLRQFPDIEDHIQFIVDGSEFQQPYGTRGIGSGRMPGFGTVLTEDQIRAIVEYERELGEQRVNLDDLVSQGNGTGDGGQDNGEPAEEQTGEGTPGGEPSNQEEGS